MNIFRFFGDLSHLVSILILIYTMRERRSSAGISFKSQCLYTAVFVARYLGIPPSLPPFPPGLSATYSLLTEGGKIYSGRMYRFITRS
jgi:hypothetical protein